jgi:hypothetical protein
MFSISPIQLLSLSLSASILICQCVSAKETANQPTHKTSPSQMTASVESGDFGIFDLNSHAVTPTRSVRFKIGDHYGWRFKVKANQPSVTWKEDFRLPVAPKTWGELEKGQRVAPDGKTCITEKTEQLKDGWIEHTWPELEGDPLGKYLMNVYVDDHLVRTFKFTVR